MEHVVERLQDEFVRAGKSLQFELLMGSLTGDRNALTYATLAPLLGLSEAAARKAAQRLRTRYRELLREEIAQTVAEPDEVDEELRKLMDTRSD